MCGRQVTGGLDWFIMEASLLTYESYHNGFCYALYARFDVLAMLYLRSVQGQFTTEVRDGWHTPER